MSASGARTIRSNGEDAARAYVDLAVPASPAPPPVEAARVVIGDPRPAPTRIGAAGSGPRNPEHMTRPEPKPPGIELPDGRPLMKAQRIWIDPELLEQWDREEAERRTRGA